MDGAQQGIQGGGGGCLLQAGEGRRLLCLINLSMSLAHIVTPLQIHVMSYLFVLMDSLCSLFSSTRLKKGVSLSYSGATSTFVQTLPICIKWGQSSVQGEFKALHCLVDRLNSLRKLKVGLCAKKHTFQSWFVVPTSNNAKLQSGVDRERREDRRGRGCPIGWGCALALTLTWRIGHWALYRAQCDGVRWYWTLNTEGGCIQCIVILHKMYLG